MSVTIKTGNLKYKNSNGQYVGIGAVGLGNIEEAVDDWLGENITNPDSPPLDRSLSSSSSAAPADMVGDLKSAVSSMDSTVISAFPLQKGNLSNNGTWNNINTSYKHIVFPVEPGDVIEFATSASMQYGVLKSYTTPASGDTVPYSEQTGFTAKITADKAKFTVPSDGKYLILECVYNTNEISFVTFFKNGYSYVDSVAENLVNIKNEIQSIEKALQGEEDLSSSYVPDYSITTNESIGTTIDITPSSSNSFGYIIEECEEGDSFIIKGTGGDGPRLWAFIDSNNKLLLVADAYAYTGTGENITVTAPQNSAKIIYNAQKSATHKLSKVILINVSETISHIDEDISDINEEIADLPDIREDITDIQEEIDNFPDVSSLEEALVEYKYVDTNLSSTYVESKSITTNVGTGNTVSLTPNDSNSFGYILANCKEGDSFTVKGTGGDGPRAWAFIDSNNKLLSAASSYAIMDYDDVTAPTNSAKAIFNLMKSTAHKVTKHGLEKVPINIREINNDFIASEQMFSKETIISGKKYDSGVITSDSNYYLSDYIAIKPSTEYTYRGLNGAINYFDVDKDYLSAESITSYDVATSKTSPSGAYYCRLQMTKLYYPYDALTMNEGDTGTKDLIYGKLFDADKIQKPNFRFSDLFIPTQYTAVGIKAVDGSTGTDFDNENPSLTDVYDAFDALVTAYPNYVSREDFGSDQSGTYHLYAYYFNPESMESSSTYYRYQYPKINLMAGIHGSYECCENVFALYYLMKSLCDSWRSSEALDYLRWNVRFAVMPVQNPYGFVNKTRQNSRGVDLNRNFSVGWKSRESGTSEYGGTAPMSEAESNAIASFAEANKDALFTVDLHGTGNSAVNQSSMIYCGVGPTDEIYYVAKALITKMSHYWDSLNISGLTASNFHGFISGSIEGDGMQRAYMIGVKKIHAMVLESFKNFSSSPYSNNSVEIMQMIGDQLGYLLLIGLNHFRN